MSEIPNSPQGWQNIEIVLLKSTEELCEVASRWDNIHWLAVDTEFERRTTFYAKLALIQVYDGEKVYLIDTLSVECSPNFKNVLENPKIVKILHSSKEDLEVLYTAWQCEIRNLFDTQVAYSFLEREISLGYAKLVEKITGEYVDKHETTSDWLKRPLSTKQLDYAAKDVLYLPAIYRHLFQKIRNESYFNLFKSECDEYTQQAIVRIEENADYREAKEAWRLDGKQLTLFKILFEWREVTARKNNQTRNHIIKEPEMVQLAIIQPTSVKDLKEHFDLHPRSIRLYANEWLNIIDHWRGEPSVTLDIIINPRDVQGLKELTAKISALVKEVAEKNNIAVTLLLSKRVIRKLAFSLLTNSNPPVQWKGWRTLLVGDKLIKTFLPKQMTSKDL